MSMAAMPKIIVGAVDQSQTGVATGMNTIMRMIGGSVGAQVAAAVLAADLIGSTGSPPAESRFTTGFVLAALSLLVALATATRLRREDLRIAGNQTPDYPLGPA